MNFNYEVETRFYFKDEHELNDKLPFLKKYFDREIEWRTKHYGLDLFKQDIILRINESSVDNSNFVTLGYKERDIGGEINIRKEYDEDIRNGIVNSSILGKLGLINSLKSVDDIEMLLERKGFGKFMSFNGRSILGYFKDLNFSLKLMMCKSIGVPCILEIERVSKSFKDVDKHKLDILKFVNEYNLLNILLKDEPPTLLYKKLFYDNGCKA